MGVSGAISRAHSVAPVRGLKEDRIREE